MTGPSFQASPGPYGYGGPNYNPTGQRVSADYTASAPSGGGQPAAARPRRRGFSIGETLCSFFKGAVVDTVKGIFTPQGMLMLAGGIALTAIGLGPVVLAAGLAFGGYQLITSGAGAAQAAASGDWDKYYENVEGVGSGAVAVGLSAYGARQFYRGGGSVASRGGTATIEDASLVSRDMGLRGTMRTLFRDVTGQVQRTGGTGGGRNLYSIARTNAVDWGTAKYAAFTSWRTGANRPLTPSQPLNNPAAVEAFLTEANTAAGRAKINPALHPELDSLASVTDPGARAILAQRLATNSELFMAEAAATRANVPLSPAEATQLQSRLATDIARRRALPANDPAHITAQQAADLNGMIRPGSGTPTNAQLQSVDAFINARPMTVDPAALAQMTGRINVPGQPPVATSSEIAAVVRQCGGDLIAAEAQLTRLGQFNQAYQGFLQSKYGADFQITSSHRVTPEILGRYQSPAEFTAALDAQFGALQTSLTPAAPTVNPGGPTPAAPTPVQPTFRQFRQGLLNEGQPVADSFISRRVAYEHNNPGFYGTRYGSSAGAGAVFGDNGQQQQFYGPGGPGQGQPVLVGFDQQGTPIFSRG